MTVARFHPWRRASGEGTLASAQRTRPFDGAPQDPARECADIAYLEPSPTPQETERGT